MNDSIKEISDKVKGISAKLDEMKQEYTRDRYENLSYILWGFALAMVSLTVTNPHPVNIVATIVFLTTGFVMSVRARRVIVRQVGSTEEMKPRERK